MTSPNVSLTPSAPRAGSSLIAAWTGERAARSSHLLLCAALAALVLNATATVEVGFTLQPSYLLALAALAVGVPFAVAGWLVIPGFVRWPAVALVAIYLVMALAGEDAVLAGSSGRSRLRDAVYLGDLVVGLGLVGLAVGLVRRLGRDQALVIGLVVGGGAAAAYALYQWFALHFGWPLSDINTAVNSDGFSRGHRYQGAGLLGWERVRGSFKEPLFLATYVATVLPCAVALWWRERGRSRLAWAVVSAGLMASLLLTVSSLTWGVALLGGLATLAFAALALGRARAAGVLGAALAVGVLLGPVLFSNPAVLAGATGRSSEDLGATSRNRIQAWDRAVRVWSERPLLGHGPGQSSVRLQYRPDGTAIAPGVRAPVVLGSAQGLWAAALIDVGVLGAILWVGFLAAILWLVVRHALARPGPVELGLLAAAVVTVCAAQFAGDRLDVRAWLVLGLCAAAACQRRKSQEGQGGHQPDQRPVGG